MLKTVHKIFWLWDFDKEEKWLREMSAKGMNLVSVGFCTYIFQKGMPDEYITRLEMLDPRASNEDRAAYITFIKDTGAEHLGTVGSWAYFRKKAACGDFDLFSDIDSRIRHLNRLLLLPALLFLLNALNSVNIITRVVENQKTDLLPIAVLILLAALLMGFGFIRILILRQRLVRERALHE